MSARVMVPLLLFPASFYTPRLEHCTHCIQCTQESIQNRTFPRLYKVIKFICSVLWAISQTEMTDFPTLLNTSISKIPTLSYTWSLKKVPLSGGASPSRTLKEVPPPPPEVNLYSVSSAEEAQKLIDDFETQHTVKVSYYMASKGFGGTGEK